MYLVTIGGIERDIGGIYTALHVLDG